MPKGEAKGFPSHTLEEALAVGQKIQDEMAGRPFRRLLLADALSIKPGSSNFRSLLSDSRQYGLTEGTAKATEISLTQTGTDATQTQDKAKRLAALRRAALTPSVFAAIYNAYSDHKLPSPETMRKLLASAHGVPSSFTEDCARVLLENGRFAEIIRDIGGSPHVLISVDSGGASVGGVTVPDPATEADASQTGTQPIPATQAKPEAQPLGDSKPETPRAIFIGHGRKQAPLARLEKILSSFQIPYKVAEEEAHLGRPISKKVRDLMLQCGSAILIFTRDEQFKDKDDTLVWRPSENVIHELGAASFAYQDRVVIFKEKGINFPTNFKDVGYIEFEEDSIESKTAELLKELIGFGLVKVTTA